MRNLIKKILREDFEWTDQAQAFELGSFEEDDVSFDDKDAKVYLGEDGKVTYNLNMEELIEYAYDGYEDWTLQTLISYNGDYSSNSYYDDYIDSDELNYVGHHFSEEQLERLEKVLLYVDTKHGIRHKTVQQYIDNDGFSNLGNSLDKLYTGTWDWDDFGDRVLSAIGAAIEKNRWENMNDVYTKRLQDHKVSIYAYNDDDIKVTMAFPYNGNHNLSEALAEIGLDDYSWSDAFYDEWDTSGAEEDVQFAFNQMIEKLEETMDEEINS